ncbi:MAG: hypothetical protein LBV28_02165 [Puniceicoccales bacterium]|jgi:hypothetical protein|nr:hypothetical protein [Puniceicoccales bacterium]
MATNTRPAVKQKARNAKRTAVCLAAFIGAVAIMTIFFSHEGTKTRRLAQVT